MKVPTKFITALSEDNFRVRNRSHAILLSLEKFLITEIAKICRVDRNTVSGWLNNRNEFKFKRLEDEEKTGRPLVLTLAEQEKVIEIGLK
jgi:transposase